MWMNGGFGVIRMMKERKKPVKKLLRNTVKKMLAISITIKIRKDMNSSNFMVRGDKGAYLT